MAMTAVLQRYLSGWDVLSAIGIILLYHIATLWGTR